MFIEAKDDGGGGDNWTTEAISSAKLQSNHHHQQTNIQFFYRPEPCALRGCKNGPAPFPGQMSYKATKPGLVFVLYLSMFFIVLVFIRVPFYVLLVFIVCVLSFGCSSCYHSLPSYWQERPL